MYECESWTIKLSAEELMLLNCGVGEGSWESFGLQGDQPVYPKGDQSWVFIGGTDVEAETPILWHLMWRADSFEIFPWCWERLRAGEEGEDRGWDGWMASLTQWTWVCIDSGSWWWTVRPGVLWLMRSQRVGHDWATELHWTAYKLCDLGQVPFTSLSWKMEDYHTIHINISTSTLLKFRPSLRI